MPGDIDAPTSTPAADPEEGRAQRRLRDLLHASTAVIERLDLEIVLRRIVESAMALVNARYGALGVIAPDGSGLERFIHVGVDSSTVAQIGQLPTGKGLLGAVIDDHVPIRLAHLTDDPRSVGFPAHHPAMDSFLGVPVRVGDQVYGNLYLTQAERGPFGPDDEELVVALAATAGIAIENARLYDATRTREIWSATAADVMAAMLEATGDDVLDVIAEHVGALIDVDLVVLAVPHDVEELRITTARGSTADQWRGRILPATGTLASRALASRRAASVDSLAPLFDGQTELGPTVAIPLFAGDEPLGALTVSRRPHSPGFTDADLEMAFAFAGQAGVAIEVVRAREDRRRLELSRDRARIARDLHDHVIQRLFGAGLSLQAISATVDAEASTAIERQIDAVDAAIKDIRTVIFALGSGDRTRSRHPRDRILDVVSEMSTGMPMTPRITFEGPLDSLVSTPLADDLTAVLRECLTNITKHADAESVAVDLSIDSGNVTLTVEDDGRGISTSVPLSGLANMAERAQLRGGTCTIGPRAGGGTRVVWAVPASIDQGRGYS
ncbi:MAG TPA: GAF domain-containing protein [Microbacterium sp.]|nr:GAF domain-containing protein [Microbacterium sp.]